MPRKMRKRGRETGTHAQRARAHKGVCTQRTLSNRTSTLDTRIVAQTPTRSLGRRPSIVNDVKFGGAATRQVHCGKKDTVVNSVTVT